MNDYSIKLGINFDDSELKNIKKQLTNLTDNTHRIRIDIDNSRLLKQIEHAKKELRELNSTKGKQPSLTVNTQSLENSLRDVATTIKDIRASIGTLDSKSGMKSLLSSINQISNALEKASNQFESLNAELKAFSSKDFSVNVGLNMGGSNPIARNAAYGSKVRNETLPQLKQQAEALEDYLKQYYKVADGFNAAQKLIQGTNAGKGKANLYDLLPKMLDSTGSLSSQMTAWKEYINIMKEAASIKGGDIGKGVNDIISGFSQTSEELVKDAQDVQSGANEIQNAIKGLFGSSIDADGLTKQLDSIVVNLSEIKTTIQSLSSGFSLDGLTQSFNKLSDAIEQLVKNCTTAKQVVNDSIGGLSGSTGQSNNGIKNINNDLKQVTITANNSADAIDSMKNAMSSMKFNTSSIDAATKDLEEMNIVIKEVTAKQDKNFDITVKGINDVGEAVNVIKRFNAETGNFDVISTKISKPFDDGAAAAKRFKKEAEAANKIKFDIEVGNFDNQMDAMHTNLNNLSDAGDELRASVKSVENAYESMLKAANADTGDEVADRERLIQAEKEYAIALEKTNNLIRIQARADKVEIDRDKLDDDIRVFQSDIDSWLTKNSAAVEKFGAKMTELKTKAESCDRVELNHLRKQFKLLDKEAEKAGLKMQSFGDRIKTKLKEYSAYFSVAEVFMYITQGLKDMFDQVVAIDTAMTELKKVTNETDSSYNRFLSNAASRAKELGTTIDGLVASTADFARLGYGFKDAQGLAEVANIYAVVGDDIDSVEQATQSLISTLTAFKDEANGLSNSDFALSIVDKMNEVANNYAISSGGIGDALQRSASSMMAANNTLDETIALITAANTVVQDPDSVGTAFKTISMRIRGAKTELEEAGLETEGMVDSTAKLRSEVMALTGIDIMDGADQFKSTYKIMQELADKWQDLSDIQQATVTELIAGKRQGNIVSSLMNNFDIAEKALETSLNSAGSAMKEHEKWQQSLEAQINKLKAAWQSLSQSFMSSDFLKSTLDIIIALTDGLDKLISTIGTLPTLLGVGSLFVGISQILSAGKEIGGLKSFNGLLLVFKDFSNIIPILTKAFPNLAKGIGVFKNSLNAASVVGQFSAALGGSAGATGLAKAAIVGKGAISGLWTVISAHPILAAIAAAAAAIVIFDKFTESSEELAKRIEETTTKYEEQHDSLIKLKGDYDTSNEDSMISKYGKLSKGVNSLGENVSLTADEYAEYQSIVDTIAGQIPSLVTGYNSQGDAILSCAGSVDRLTQAYKDLIIAQNDEVLKTGGDIFKDFENDLDASVTGSRGGITGVSAIQAFRRILDGDSDVWVDSPNDVQYISEILEKNGIERDKLGSGKAGFETSQEHIQRALEEDFANVKKILDEETASVNAYAEELGLATQAYFNTAFLGGNGSDIGDYSHMSDRMQNLINQITSGFGSEFYSQFLDDENPYESLTKYFDDMLTAFDKLGSGNKANLEAAFDLQTQFNGGKISYGEYVKGIQDAEKIIDTLDVKDEVKSQIKLSLNTDKVKKDYDALTERLVNISTKDLKKMGHFSGASEEIKAATEEAKKFLDSLTASEYAVFVDLVAKGEVDLSQFDIESFRKYLEEEAKLKDALNFEANIEVDTTALETLNEILAESASAMGLSTEAIDSLKAKYSDLDGYDPATLFERTANGVKVNREELERLEKKQNDLTKSKVQKHLDTLINKYNDVTAEIDKCTNAGERAELLSEREGYASKIEELATYQAQLEGVTGAYQDWINAQNTPEDYEGYEAVATGREDIQDEIDRGFIGNSTKKYIDLLSGEDLDGKSVDDYADAWEKLDDKVTGAGYSINDFFTVNDDGDITSKGIDRFFKSLQTDFEGSVAKFDDKTKKWSYDFGAENLEKIKKKWGIGIEAIELLLEAAASAGYDIDWDGILDGIDFDTSNFETLVSTAEAAQTAFNKLEGVEDVDFNFTTTGVEEATSELEKARSTYIDLITNKDGTINLSANGAAEMRVILSTLLIQKQQLEDSTIAINIDTSGLDESQQDIANAINAVKTFREKYKNLEIAVTTGQGIEQAKTELNTAMTELQGLGDAGVNIAAELILGEGASAESLNSKVNAAISAVGSKDIKVGCKLDETDLGALNSQVLTNFTPEATVKITGIDDTLVGEYTSTEKTANGKVKWSNDTALVVQFQEKTHKASGIVDWANNIEKVKTKFSAAGTVTWTSGNNVKVNVVSEAKGTANADGSAQSGRAFARGNWGIGGNGVALGGELGQELVVRDGHFFTIGDTGAEFFKYKKNDIIFNAAQTESLFKYGGIKGAKPRGKMLATGSAFAEGNYLSNGKAFPWSATASESNFVTNRVTGQSYGSKDSDKSKDKDFEEIIDWIEVIIDRVERAIDKFDQQANNIYKSWSSRNKALQNQISEVSKEIGLQQQAKSKYMSAANGVGLSESWAKKVRNGEIDIDTITDETLAEKIKSYQDYYEKVLDCEEAIRKLQEQESELYAQRFENIQTQYDSILQGYEHTKSMLDEYISQAEEQGYIVSKRYYDALVENEKSNIAQLEKEQADLIEARDEAVDSGKITKYSEAWYDMCAEIDSVTQAIEEGNTALIEYNNALRDIDWQIFDLIQERISGVTEEANFLIDLMSNEKLFDDDGKLTSQGLATMALHGQNYNAYMYQADEYREEIYGKDGNGGLNKLIEEDPANQELINRRNELLELQRESILASEDEKNAIRDMVEEGIEYELDALQERIDLYSEALDSQKDLYDYQKRVEEQTENIASLRKQIGAYEGFDDEETRAKVQELKVSLEEAEADLFETEYDKYISDQQVLLDNLYNEYELILNTRLDNIDYLLESVIESINAAASAEGTIATALGSEGAISIAVSDNATSIKDTLVSEVGKVGTNLSTAMSSIWTGEGAGKAVIATYGEDFKAKSATTITTLNDIRSDIKAMVDDVDKEYAQKKVAANKTTASAKKNPTTTNKTNNKNNNKNNNTSNGDGKPKVGDKVKFVSGKYYYDSYGTRPLGSHKQGQYVYITHINNNKKATHPYHISTGNKLGSGDLGWLKLDQLSGYATGKKNFLGDEIAWTQENGREFIVRPSDGAILTPVAKGDSVLSANASKNIWNMANSPAEFIKDNLNLGASNVPNNSNVQSNYTQHLDKVVFNLPNVKNYEELLVAMQKDKNFERLINSMTVDRIAGKTGLAKGKSIR